MKFSKKILAAVLAALMAISMMPITVFATTYDSGKVAIDNLREGDIITTSVNKIIGLDEYSLTLQAGGYGSDGGNAENTDLRISWPEFSNGSVVDEEVKYYPFDENGNKSDKWYVVALDHGWDTITLSGIAPAPLTATFTGNLVDTFETGIMNKFIGGDELDYNTTPVQKDRAYEISRGVDDYGLVVVVSVPGNAAFDPADISFTIGETVSRPVSADDDDGSAAVCYDPYEDGDSKVYQFFVTKAAFTDSMVVDYTPSTPAPVVKPDGFNLSIEDKIHMNLYINVDDYTDPETATVTVTYNDPEKQTPTLKVDTYSGEALAALKDEEDGRYVIPVLAAPAQIRDNVSVTVTDRDDSITTSVAEYCETIIAESNDGALVDLANAILDYGKACSVEFNYNVDAFNDKDYHYSGINATEYLNSKAFINTENAKGKFTGYSYIAKAVPALRIYLNATEAEVVANDLKATVNGTEVTPKVEEGTGRVCVDITGILAESLDVKQTVEFNGGTLTLNALQYAKAKGGDTDFGRSMTVYSFTAYAYFKS